MAEKTAFDKCERIVYFAVKRIFDIVCALVGIVLLIPVAIIVKLAYMLSGDFHTIFYKQRRIGKNGKPFNMFKFRSMVYDAEEALRLLLKDASYRQEWDENQKLDNDPRITGVGRFLRKASLDELPQFINVFIGNMSLIGPRPLVEGELDEHNGNHEIYESVTPGISGWWAANGRSTIAYDKRLELEYYYCQNCSIWLDIKCIFLTVITVVSAKNAK